ncbi:hypothetical protein LZ30DRAFT_275430 [Colletotrichum cereale]|nr:hypothetical protein LZ30DRAFT_275430 [Colletotrichum cereale]
MSRGNPPEPAMLTVRWLSGRFSGLCSLRNDAFVCFPTELTETTAGRGAGGIRILSPRNWSLEIGPLKLIRACVCPFSGAHASGEAWILEETNFNLSTEQLVRRQCQKVRGRMTAQDMPGPAQELLLHTIAFLLKQPSLFIRFCATLDAMPRLLDMRAGWLNFCSGVPRAALNIVAKHRPLTSSQSLRIFPIPILFGASMLPQR